MTLHELKFETRDEYLAWRSEWKAEYFALARKIRKAKRHYRQPHAQILRWEGTTPITQPGIDGYKAMTALHCLKADARFMLDVRAASKKKAGEQWRAARAMP